jgi:hypothetical protein
MTPRGKIATTYQADGEDFFADYPLDIRPIVFDPRKKLHFGVILHNLAEIRRVPARPNPNSITRYNKETPSKRDPLFLGAIYSLPAVISGHLD